MKKWSKRILKTEYVLPFDMQKADLRKAIDEKKTFSLLGKVVEIKKNEEEKKHELTIRDSTRQVWKFTIPQTLFAYLTLNDIVNISNVKSSQENALKLLKDTNILKFFSHSKLFQHLLAVIRAKVEMKTALTRFSDNASYKVPTTSLKKLFITHDKLPELSRVKFCIIKILPDQMQNWAQAWDGEKYSIIKNNTIPEGSTLRWNLRFIVTDYSCQSDTAQYMIRLREGYFFKGMKPSKWLNLSERKKAVKIKKLLLKFQLHFLDVLVTKEKDGFYIKKTYFNSLRKPMVIK